MKTASRNSHADEIFREGYSLAKKNQKSINTLRIFIITKVNKRIVMGNLKIQEYVKNI